MGSLRGTSTMGSSSLRGSNRGMKNNNNSNNINKNNNTDCTIINDIDDNIRGESDNFARCMFRTNPIIIGILMYIMFFQLVIYHSKEDTYRLDILTSTLPQQQTTAFIPETTTTTIQQQQRRTSSVGVFPHIPPSTPTNPVEWKPYSSIDAIDNIKLPFPIFVTSLPKSGTTSIWKYFKCGGIFSSHNWITKIGQTKAQLIGPVIHDNIKNNKPPFDDCGEFDVFTDTGYLNYDHDGGTQCFYPSIDGLDAIYMSYPNATFINVVRDAEEWYESLKKWSHSSLFVRFRLCNATGFPDGQSTKQDFINFYNNHNDMIRQFVKDRPSITYLEVKLESTETGQILQNNIGITQECWKQCRPQEKKCRPLNNDDENNNANEKPKQTIQQTRRKIGHAVLPLAFNKA